LLTAMLDRRFSLQPLQLQMSEERFRMLDKSQWSVLSGRRRAASKAKSEFLAT